MTSTDDMREMKFLKVAGCRYQVTGECCAVGPRFGGCV